MMLVLAGCHAPGKPGAAEPRPDRVMDFAKLYKQNCAACHGEDGKRGLAVSLSNPVYIAIAGKDAILNATAKGGPGKLMPAFAKSYGGALTDAQIEVLADGIVRYWGQPQLLAGKNPPSYAATLAGDASAGKADYTAYCARCHAAEATDKTHMAGPIADANYLALISDQGLRTAILSGQPEEGMPDWRGIAPKPLTDRQVTDMVAWLASLRKTSASPNTTIATPRSATMRPTSTGPAKSPASSPASSPVSIKEKSHE
jgi:cytochrome c oxidase cbb3-type subunit 3/ubiquinol-cytochrome c reductase cytochrome c subunit